MQKGSVTRRHFLKGSGAAAASTMWPGGLTAMMALAQSACSARDEAATYRVLDGSQARELEAIAARIIPMTDTPGAREAGVIHFIDQALDTVFANKRAETLAGLEEFQQSVAEAFDGAGQFSDLAEADQDAALRNVEDGEFFRDMRFATIVGFFAMSKYGGAMEAGWKLVGMDPNAHGHQPPFGHYDAEYMQGEQDGE